VQKNTQQFDRSIVEGPIGPAVWRLAWPTMLQNVIAGVPSATIAGQNLGAGKPDRAMHGVAVTARIGVGVAAVVGLMFSIVSQIVVPIGLCTLLQAVRGLHPSDIWLAIVLGHFTRAALSVLRFRQGKWRHIFVDIEPAAEASSRVIG
jgi:Na+-driven multidrug efflux pump